MVNFPCWRSQTASAFIAGAVSAFAFEPVGWWPLILVAIAALCELIDRATSLRRSLLLGFAFGFGQFVIGLNWIATSFTYQSNMPPWLGWIAVVLLSLYLAIYPAMAAGLAWRFGRDDRVVGNSGGPGAVASCRSRRRGASGQVCQDIGVPP